MTTTQFVAISEGNYGCYQRYNCFAQVNTWIRNRAVKKLTRIAQRLLHGRIGAHRILRKIETERTCSQLYTYIHEAVQFEPNLRNDETRSAAERPLSAICYRPTVFLLHLRHIALPAPVQANIRSAFNNAIISRLFFF